MIDRYSLKVALAVSQKDLLKKLDEMKEFDPEEMKKIHHLR